MSLVWNRGLLGTEYICKLDLMISLPLRHCTIPMQLPTKQMLPLKSKLAGKNAKRSCQHCLVPPRNHMWRAGHTPTLHCCRETWSCASSHPSLATTSLLDLLLLNLSPQGPLLIDICLISVSHTSMWEGRKICKAFPLYYHHLTALSENQHNPSWERWSLWWEGN